MATIQITIDTSGDEFHLVPLDPEARVPFPAPGFEVARILRKMADQFERVGLASDPCDSGGNVVGTCRVI